MKGGDLIHIDWKDMLSPRVSARLLYSLRIIADFLGINSNEALLKRPSFRMDTKLKTAFPPNVHRWITKFIMYRGVNYLFNLLITSDICKPLLDDAINDGLERKCTSEILRLLDFFLIHWKSVDLSTGKAGEEEMMTLLQILSSKRDSFVEIERVVDHITELLRDVSIVIENSSSKAVHANDYDGAVSPVLPMMKRSVSIQSQGIDSSDKLLHSDVSVLRHGFGIFIHLMHQQQPGATDSAVSTSSDPCSRIFKTDRINEILLNCLLVSTNHEIRHETRTSLHMLALGVRFYTNNMKKIK